MPIRFYNPIFKKAVGQLRGVVSPPTPDPSRITPTYEELVSLLEEARDSLRGTADVGEWPYSGYSPVVMEIDKALARISPKIAHSKKSYGYDTSGETQSGSGSGGNQKNVQDNSTGNATDGHGSPKNPANFMTDGDANDEFPEIQRPSKIRFLTPRGIR